jgi:glycosyltransferase involved in cell wall biosynthesis
LAEFYQIHYVCWRPAVEVCQQSGLCQDWIFHPVDVPSEPEPGLKFYRYYHQWCRRATALCLELIPQIRPAGLHHPSLGSFRMLPGYFRLPIPYTLGPLGGGETAPLRLLLGASLPRFKLGKELCRPLLNYACLLNPHSRRVLRQARLVLATTPETERLVRWAGARNTAVVFPDAIDLSGSSGEPISRRKEQAASLSRKFRCVWSGRFLWWKGGQIAVRFLHRLRREGVDASLDIYSDGAGIERLKQMAGKLGLGDEARFNGMVPRAELLRAYESAHLFVYPTLHDSSSSAIPEAYSTGLPSMTLALGGTWIATARNAGWNETPADIESWLADGAALVKRWIEHPDHWVLACQAALEKAREFSPAAITLHAQTHLLPCYK